MWTWIPGNDDQADANDIRLQQALHQSKLHQVNMKIQWRWWRWRWWQCWWQLWMASLTGPLPGDMEEGTTHSGIAWNADPCPTESHIFTQWALLSTSTQCQRVKVNEVITSSWHRLWETKFIRLFKGLNLKVIFRSFKWPNEIWKTTQYTPPLFTFFFKNKILHTC